MPEKGDDRSCPQTYSGPFLDGPIGSMKGQMYESPTKSFTLPAFGSDRSQLLGHYFEWDEDAKGWRHKGFQRQRLTP